MKPPRYRRTVLTIVLLTGTTLLLGYLFVPAFRHETNALLGMLARADITPARDYLLGFGIWAPLVSALLQIITSVVAPLPSFVLAFVNALVFGFAWGALLTFSTALLASAICFGLARTLGRPTVERFVSRSMLGTVDTFFDQYGVYAVLVARLIPFMNPDVVSYAAGLTRIRWRWFLASIALGSAPSTLLYSYLGAQGVTSLGWFLAPLVGLGVLTLVIALWRARSPRARTAETTR